MSKAIRWQVPFASISGTKYRVDIYDEGYTGTPVQLLAGETPFVTDEDSSEDFFAPIRTQTGTLQVCTALPNGGRISLDELLPANNIARPVRLINLDNSNAIEWQGFLSCEAYDQDYTSIPQILQLPVISVLEAMESVTIDYGSINGCLYIHNFLAKVLYAIEYETGMSFWTYIYYSAAAYRIFGKEINTAVMYDVDEIQTTDSLNYVLNGTNAKECLERLCQFMGMVARENGRNIYIERIGEEIGMYRDTLVNFRDNFQTNAVLYSLTSSDMETLQWMGAGHQRSISQGANRVEVVAKVSGEDPKIDLPEYPGNNQSNLFGLGLKGNIGDGIENIYPSMVAEQNDTYYNILTYRYYYGQIATSPYVHTDNIISAIRSNFLDHTIIKNGYDSQHPLQRYAGGALTQFSLAKEVDRYGYRQNKKGLYCGIFPNGDESLAPIVSIRNPKVLRFLGSNASRLRVKASCYYIGYDRTNNRAILTEKISSDLGINGAKIRIGLRWGEEVIDDNVFVTRQTGSGDLGSTEIHLDDGGFEATFGTNYIFDGDMELAIYSDYFQSPYDNNILYELLITDLSVTLEVSDSAAQNENSENKYAQLLGTKFRDSISIQTDFASDLNNDPFKLYIYDQDSQGFGVLLKTLEYSVSGGTTEYRRPEEDLLSRLASYYGAARQRLKLEVAHPTAAPLPLLQLYGINDGKVYLPLSESHDWRTNICQLTCFETI